jgi:carbon-monoxide dehydrogenase medium subunit
MNNRSYLNDEMHQHQTADLRGRPVQNRWIGQRSDDPAPDLAGLARAQGALAFGPVSEIAELLPTIRDAVAHVSDGATSWSTCGPGPNPRAPTTGHGSNGRSRLACDRALDCAVVGAVFWTQSAAAGMKPPPFEYLRPSDLQEALDMRHQWKEESRPLAGGQSLIPLLRLRLARVERLIDIGRLSELEGIEIAPDGSLAIGAMTRQLSTERSPLVREHCPLLAEAVSLIGCAQIRARGTIGGSAAHADPTAELPAALTALDAVFEVASVREQRVVSAEEMFVSYFETGLRDDELLTRIMISRRLEREGSAILEVARRAGDHALVGVAVRVGIREDRCEVARIVAFGVGEGPTRVEDAETALMGSSLRDVVIDDAANAFACGIDPPSDHHATGAYRRHAVTVLCRRALALARTRAADSREAANR